MRIRIRTDRRRLSRLPGFTAVGDLWGNPEFLKLWLSATVSLAGTQVSLLAVPLTAVLTLHATPAEMGLLSAVQYVPTLLFGLFAGVLVDRLPSRMTMIVADLLRAGLMVSIPLTAIVGVLYMSQLYVIAFAVGTLTILFDLAQLSLVPATVRPPQLVEANGKLQMSRSIAQIVGPGISGGLIGLISAPLAIIVDVMSYLLSAGCLAPLNTKRADSGMRSGGGNMLADISEGLRFVMKQPLIRVLTGRAGTYNFFVATLSSVYVLYLTRDMGLSPVELGLIFGGGGFGALLAAVVGTRLVQLWGMGPVIVGAAVLSGVGALGIPLVRGPALVVVVLLTGSQAIIGFGTLLYDMTQISLRQAITPERILGRANATVRFVVWGTRPFGALLGGLLGEVVGLRLSLAIASAGMLAAVLWLIGSPLQSLREPPPPVVEP